MPFLNAPQAPSRAFYQPQIPQTTIDIGGSDNSDMALMLALIDMLNRTEEGRERRALDRELADIQKGAQKQAKRTQDRVAFNSEVGSIQGQVEAAKNRKTSAFQRNQRKFVTKSTEIMGRALDDPGVRSFVRELGSLDQKGESEALRFINGMPDRIEKVLNRIDEPLGRLGAARALNGAVGNYVTGGGVHANSLEDVYTRGLAGVRSMARKAETVIAELSEQRQTAFEEFLQTHEKPIQKALQTARELDDPLSGLPGIHKQVRTFSDPELSLFTVPSSSFDMPGLRGSIRNVESDRVIRRTPGAPEEVLEEVKGFPAQVGGLLSGLFQGLSRGLGGETTVRTEGGEIRTERPAEDILNAISRKAHGFAPEELFTGLPQPEMRIDLPGLGGLPMGGISRDRAAVPSFLRPNAMGPPGPTDEEVLEALQSGLIGG